MNTLLKTNQNRPSNRCVTDHSMTARLRGRFATFRREEDGSMVIMTLFIFLFMMVMAGLGIDTMRHEMERAKLQSTLDSAVLAGAKAPFGEDPEVIVKDYFAKAKMSKYLNEFQDGDVVTSLNSSKVTASASMTMDTYLMKLSGVKSLSAHAKATAETRVPKLEIALVLDVSGSMNTNNKIGELRTAAKEFVTTIMNSADPGDAVISIVPFSTSVQPSEDIFDALLINETHDYSSCLVFDDDDYNDTALVTEAAAAIDLTLTPMEQDIYSSRYGNFDALNQSWRSCYTEDGFRVMHFSTSEADLHAKIDGFVADGNTTGDLGVKWGAALLDPSFRDVTDALITAGEMPASMATTPVDYSEADTMKVIVMMGDGQNTETYFFADNSDYRGPDSDLFHVEYEDEVLDYAYYVYNSNYRREGPSYEYLCSYWYWKCVYEPSGTIESAYFMRDPDSTFGPGLLTTTATAVASVGGAAAACAAMITNFIEYNWEPGAAFYTQNCDDALPAVRDALLDDWYYYDIDNGQWLNGFEFTQLDDSMSGFLGQERLDWEEAWGMMSPDEYGDITGIYDAHTEYLSNGVDGATKNVRMDSVCSAAKTNGVVVYTIGYMVGDGSTAEQSLKKCSTGYSTDEDASSYYYPVKDVDISKAFSSIAGNVQALRLTQ